MQNELDVIARLHERDSNAIKILLDLYWNNLYAIGTRFRLKSDVIEDLITESFITLCKKPPADATSFERIKAFLIVTFRNKALNQLKSDKRVAERQKGYNYLRIHQQNPDENEDLIENYFKHLQPFLQNLPKRSKEVLELIIKEGLTDEQIAKRLGLEITNIRVIKSNAVKTLKKIMNGQSDSNNGSIRSLIPILIKLILIN